MNMTKEIDQNKKVNEVITPEELIRHWQGHRGLTRRVIEAFPEKEFFTFSIGGMRTFAELTVELLSIAVPGVKEIVTGETTSFREEIDHGNLKSRVLELWDEATADLDELWQQIPRTRFHDNITTFGQYEGTVLSSVLYFIDNEIHHRGQGYVYLRALGVTPPFFWDR